MNKKLFLGMFAVASMLLATSCSNDELDVVQSGNEAQITFSVGAKGGIATRAYSDGKSADKLVWAVYNEAGTLLNVFKNGENYVGQETHTSVQDMTTTAKEVTVNLAKGQKYHVLFWAQDADCTAYNTAELRSVKVNYPVGAKNNDESRDAFFACKTIEVKGNETFKVDLKRPFAQINVGVTAEDWAAAKASGIEVKQSKVVIKKAAQEIDLLHGTVSGSQEVTYALEDIISDQTLDVDLNGDDKISDDEKYKWLSMSYILVDESTTGAAKTNLESLEFTFKPEKGNDIIFKEGLNNVPVKRNWRTNIIGQILTGTIKFKVKIDKEFLGDHNVNIVRDEDNKITYVNDVPYKDNAVMYQKDDGTYADATTLSAAINSAPAGSVITIGKGEITTENNITNVNKSITIKGLGASETKVNVPARFYVATNATEITIEGVTMEWNNTTNSQNPIHIENNGNVVPQLTLKDCTFSMKTGSKVPNGFIYYQHNSPASGLLIDNCVFKTTGNYSLNGGMSGSVDKPIVIKNSTFGSAINFEMSGADFQYITIEDCQVNGYRGLAFVDNGQKFSNITVEGNYISKLRLYNWSASTNSENLYYIDNTGKTSVSQASDITSGATDAVVAKWTTSK